VDDLRKAAEMALEALDSLDLHDGQLWFSECDPEWFDSVTTALRQALAQPEQEPVGYVTNSGTSAWILKDVDLDDDTPLYTAPPKREWVGLTYEEARAIRLKVGSASDVYAVAIEEALKEKNT
jgi:hypothetical protein